MARLKNTPFTKYLQRHGARNGQPMTISAFARLCGTSRTGIYRIIAGGNAVSFKLLARIEKATRGEVGVVQLFNHWHAARTARRRLPPSRRRYET
jgi:hypothetical protein